MKRGLIICLLFALPFVFTSCSDDDDAPFLGAKVNVTVKNLLGTVDGTTVYMYKDSEPQLGTTKPENADKQAVTNADGVAEFNLNFTELNILESQTTLYFAIFFTVGDQSYLKASTGVTLERNDVKNVDINAAI